MHYLKRYTIVYNGEIYNFPEIKKILQQSGYHFNSNSDTEVILAAYDFYGEKCLQKFDGMFAFAIWDEQTQSLFAARDRFGEKPFYYFNKKSQFVFASEMKAIWAAGIPKVMVKRMLLNYISLGTVQYGNDKSQTFFQDVYSLPPAHYLTFKKSVLSVHCYWKLDKQTTIQISEGEAAEYIDELLKKSVSLRLRSDVPVASNLSGGLDSSSILYYINKQQENTKTFSAVFPGYEKDESSFINIAASTFGVENYQVTFKENDFIKDFENLVYHQEEPFQSSSLYAQYRVFQLAKKNKIKVLMDGQGADEIFAGYHRYVHWYLQELINQYKFGKCFNEKKQLRKNSIPLSWGLKNIIAAYFPSHVSIALEKKAYHQILHHSDLSENMFGSLHGSEWEGIHKPIVTKLNDILHFDVMEMGLEELLRFADRNAMAHSCETRFPFLNHELVSFIFTLPSSFKIHNGYTKFILRKAMQHKLPDEIVWRKDKVAFETPQKKWMTTKIMQEYIHEAKRKLVENDILKSVVLGKKIIPTNPHENGSSDWKYLCIASMID